MMRMLFALFGLMALGVTFAIAVDEFGAGAPPWFGWWDATITVAGPYTLSITPRANGAAARSGFRDGDRFDLRQQSVKSRIAATYQPVTTERTTFLILRGAKAVTVRLTASTVWDNASVWKLQPMVSRLLGNLFFIVCAGQIALRRRHDAETTALAVAILGLVGTMLDPSFFVVSQPALALTLFVLSRVCASGVALIFVWLAYRWRRSAPAFVTCAAVAVAFIADIAVVIGLSTARIDPLPFILSLSLGRSLLDAVVWLLVALTAVVASRRSRSAWLLVPLPTGLLVSSLCFASPSFIHVWIANVAAPAVANIAVLLGTFFATREALRRSRNSVDPPPVNFHGPLSGLTRS